MTNKAGPPIGRSNQEKKERLLMKGPVVWDLKINGYSNKEISDKVNIPLRTIQDWIKTGREKALQQMDVDAATELAMIVAQNRGIYKIAMEAIKRTVTLEDGTDQVFMDTKSADIALKALKEMARLMSLGVKDESSGEGSLEELILASIMKKSEVKVIEAEIVEDSDE